jgi:hypothetical protein
MGAVKFGQRLNAAARGLMTRRDTSSIPAACQKAVRESATRGSEGRQGQALETPGLIVPEKPGESFHAKTGPVWTVHGCNGTDPSRKEPEQPIVGWACLFLYRNNVKGLVEVRTEE